jgi:dynein heavy chain
LVGYQQDVEAFKRKDPPVLNLDEMRTNSKTLDRLGDLLSKARSELDAINTEEELLEMEPTLSPLLQHLIALREPYDKLWHTAMDFTQKHERWFHGEINCTLNITRPFLSWPFFNSFMSR